MTVGPEFELDPALLRSAGRSLDRAASRFRGSGFTSNAPATTPDAGQSTSELAEVLGMLFDRTAGTTDFLTMTAFNLDAANNDYVKVDEANEKAFQDKGK